LIISGTNNDEKEIIKNRFYLNKKGVNEAIEEEYTKLGYGISAKSQISKNLIVSVYKKLLSG
jgi:hypothetical protein